VVLAGYALSLATVMSAHSAPPSGARLARWLLAHHLDYGLGGYGIGNTVTLDTGGRVHVVVVVYGSGHCYPFRWEAEASSYDPRLHDATFVVQSAPVAVIRKVFGTPARVYHFGRANILVWHKNLLTEVQRAASGPGHGAPHRRSLLPGGL
jgi:hypothetical protein